MMASIAVLFVTDSIYGYIVLHSGYDNATGYLEGGWGLFYLLWAAAALHPSIREFDEPAREGEPRHPRRRLIMLAGASLLAPCITFVVAQRVLTKVTAAAAAFTFALVLVRLNGLMVDINEYRRSVRALREADVKYRSLVEGLPAVVYVAQFGQEGGAHVHQPPDRDHSRVHPTGIHCRIGLAAANHAGGSRPGHQRPLPARAG